MNDIVKDKIVDFRDIARRQRRTGIPACLSALIGQECPISSLLGQECPVSLLAYAQALETRRRLKIAAAFFEPNSLHYRPRSKIGLRAQPALEIGKRDKTGLRVGRVRAAG